MRRILSIIIGLLVLAPLAFGSDPNHLSDEEIRGYLTGSHGGEYCHGNPTQATTSVTEEDIQRALRSAQNPPEGTAPVEQATLDAARSFIRIAGDPDARFYPKWYLSSLSADVGILVLRHKNKYLINIVRQGSSAEAAGIRAGDILVSINGKNANDFTSDEIYQLLHGKEGTPITITFFRGSRSITVSLMKKKQNATGSFEVNLKNNVVYIKIRRFDNVLEEDLRSYLAKQNYSAIDGIILDLRDNDGGILSGIKIIAELFLPKGIKYGQQVYFNGVICNQLTKRDPLFGDKVPLVVLINQGTSGGAEMIAAALRNRQRTLLLGEPTLGVSTRIEQVIEFRDRSMLRIRISTFLAGEGRGISDAGIRPNIVNKQRAKGNRDSMLTRANAELKKMSLNIKK